MPGAGASVQRMIRGVGTLPAPLGACRAAQSPLVLDAGLVTGLCALGWSSLWARGAGPETGLGLVGAVLLVAQVLPLVARRRFPLLVLLVVLGAASAYASLDYRTTPIGLAVLVAMAGLASRRSGPSVVLGLSAGVVSGVGVAFLGEVARVRMDAAANGALVLAAWTAGVTVRLRRERAASLEARAASEAAVVVQEAQGVVQGERLALAGAVHDRVGHVLACLVRQCEAAQQAGPGQRDHLLARMRASMGAALHDAEEAVAALSADGPELRAMGEDGRDLPEEVLSLPAGPTGGIGGVLRHWVSDLAPAGVEVWLSASGRVESASADVEALAARVVGEGLANVACHSTARRADGPTSRS